MVGHVEYDAIVASRVDRAGNLQLFRRGRLFDRQAVFHPAGEWESVQLNEHGVAVVELVAPSAVIRSPPRGA